MNVYIYPSPADMNNVEGLCGHFNGNWSDDFVHRNGAKTQSQSYYWRWWWWGGDPVDFSKSWQYDISLVFHYITLNYYVAHFNFIFVTFYI